MSFIKTEYRIKLTSPINKTPALVDQLIHVRLSGQLRDWTNGVTKVELDLVPNVLSAIKKLDRAYPGIGQRIVDDQDKIRTHVNVFVNLENSRDLGREKTKLRDGDTIHVLPAVSGG